MIILQVFFCNGFKVLHAKKITVFRETLILPIKTPPDEMLRVVTVNRFRFSNLFFNPRI